MSHTKIFKKVIDTLKPVNRMLSDEKFIASCADVLRGDGVIFKVSDRKKVVIPYEGSGIYMFWAKLSTCINNNEYPLEQLLSAFLDNWDQHTESVSYFPKSNRERTKKTLGTIKSGNMVPFYLGKSEKLAHRINQHLYIEPNKRTYALKLKSRVTLLKGITFKITWLPLETTKENYFIVSKAESLLRETLLPIIGKQ